MNRSQIVGATMCGIILDNGRDCPAPVDPDCPLNLCLEHLHRAWDWYSRTSAPQPEITECPDCGENAAQSGLEGKTCVVCGWRSEEYIGRVHLLNEVNSMIRESRPRQVDVVYYIQFQGLIKIVSKERERHLQFRHLRQTGEWFKATPELLDHAQSLMAPGIRWQDYLHEWENQR